MRIVVFSLLTLMLISACNTMEGLGEDVGKLGNKIEGSAKRHNN